MLNSYRGGGYFCLLIPLMLWCLFPIVSFNIYFRLLCVVCLAALFASLLLKNLEVRNYRIRLEVLVVFSLLLYMWVTNWIFSSSEFRLRHLHFSMMLVMGVLAYWLLKSRARVSYVIVVSILLLNSFTLLRTIFALLLDHNVSRYLSKSNEFSEQLAASGIAGYGVVYANVVLLPILLIALKVFKRSGNYFLRVLTSINIFLCLFFIVKAQYTIAILLTILALVFLAYSAVRRHIYLLAPVMLASVFVFIYYVSEYVSVENVQFFLEGTRYRVKFLDLISLFESGAQLTDDSVGGRLYAYMKSVSVFFESPVFGSLAFDYQLGAHSDILDKFAQWGVFIGALVVFSISWFFQVVKSVEGKEFSREIFVAQFCLLVIALFNTLAMEVGVVFIFLSGVLVFDERSRYSGKQFADEAS